MTVIINLIFYTIPPRLLEVKIGKMALLRGRTTGQLSGKSGDISAFRLIRQAGTYLSGRAVISQMEER